MSHNNGYHLNGKHDEQMGVGGGAPGTIKGDLADGNRKRSTYVMLQRAINSAMDLPEGTLKAAAGTAIRDLNDKDGRVRARAREFLLKLQDSGVAAAIGLDKIERLDDGGPTDILKTLAPDVSERAASIARLADDCED